MTRSIASLAVFLFCCMERTISTKIYLFSTSPFTYCGIHVPYSTNTAVTKKAKKHISQAGNQIPLLSFRSAASSLAKEEERVGRRRRRRGASNLLSFLLLSPGASPPPKAEKKKRFPFFPSPPLPSCRRHHGRRERVPH